MYQLNQKNINIACIIPTRERRELLLDTLKSVFEQKFLPVEIIVVNNGGESLVLPQAYDSRVKVYNIIPNAGVAQARNFGAIMARSEYLAFLDDDDLWNPDYLENVARALTDTVQCVVSRLDKFEDGKISSHKNANGALTIQNILTFNPGITGSNVVISKKLFFAVGGYDPKLPPSEDKSLILEVLLKGFPVKTLPENQAIRRIHKGARLTEAKKMAEGIFQFTRKYHQQMRCKQLLLNRLKICRHRFYSGEKKIFPLYAIYYLLFRLTPR